MLSLDHVLLAVADLDAAGARLFDEHGLASVFGGEHAGAGTANRIVPLGDTYIELIGVTDADVAGANVLGRAVRDAAADGDRLMAWAVATDEIDNVAKWIGSTVTPSSRARPDGVELRWRMTGVDGALAERSLPFFIKWDVLPEDHPGRTLVEHRTQVKGLTELEVGGRARTIANRLHGADLPIRVVSGEHGPRSITIATSDGEVVLR